MRRPTGGAVVTTIGLGHDVVDVPRFAAVLARTPGVADRVFTPAERAYAAQRRDPTERYAVRFAAKEAVMKALGVGLGEVRLRDIEVVRGDGGAPQVLLHETAAALAADRGVTSWLVSLTHTATVASAVVIAMGDRP